MNMNNGNSPPESWFLIANCCILVVKRWLDQELWNGISSGTFVQIQQKIGVNMLWILLTDLKAAALLMLLLSYWRSDVVEGIRLPVLAIKCFTSYLVSLYHCLVVHFACISLFSVFTLDSIWPYLKCQEILCHSSCIMLIEVSPE